MEYSFNKHIIITGHFGSGKTNIAISLALYLKNKDKKVALIDIDIVNPYFRAFDAVKELEKAGIKVIAPTFANTNLEVSLLPGEINTAFGNDFDHVIFDVGGDADGAKALGVYSDKIKTQGYTMLYVINKFRPLTATIDDSEMILEEIETSGRLKVNGIINNSNLGGATAKEDIKESISFSKELAKKTGMPLAFTTVLRELGIKINNENIFKIDIHTNKFFD